jgi:flagellar protein FlaG
MTTLEKIDTSAAIARNKLVESTKVVQNRQEVSASGKSMPVAKPAGVSVEERKKELDQAVKNVSGYVQNITRELNFSIDEELGRPVVTVLDQETGEIIRQIPNEEMLELAKNISEVQDKSLKQGARGVLFQGDA